MKYHKDLKIAMRPIDKKFIVRKNCDWIVIKRAFVDAINGKYKKLKNLYEEIYKREKWVKKNLMTKY